MKVRLKIVVEGDDGVTQSVDEVACLERTGLTPATLASFTNPMYVVDFLF